MENKIEYITTKEAAVLAGVSHVTINKWIGKGLINALRPVGTKKYRIPKEEFLTFLQS